MTNEIMGKRTDGAGGGGGGGSGPGGPSARIGRHQTRKVCAEFRDHFDDFEAACYRAHSIEGTDGAAIWRRLAERLEAAVGLAAKLLPVLRAEIVEMEAGSKSVADDLPSEPSEPNKEP